jgi:predicted nucleic acid-binding protein
MTTFLDTNVLIDLLNPEAEKHQWCFEQVTKARELGPIVISDIVYCELSVGLDSKEATDQAIADLALDRLPCSDISLFDAGRAYKKYKQEHGGPKLGVLPDFLIGAQANAENAPLLTSNQSDFLSYFPNMKIIHPGS